MEKEINHSYTITPICPYCGHEYRIDSYDDCDLYESAEGGGGNTLRKKCIMCNEQFYVETEIVAYRFTTEKIEE